MKILNPHADRLGRNDGKGRSVGTLYDGRSDESAPAISVIIPCRNEEEFLSVCLTSVRNQVTPVASHEIIVVDNGSTDRSVDEAVRAGVQLVLLVQGRVGAVRNAGAAAARGRVLLFLDADVVLTPEWTDRARERFWSWDCGDSDEIWGAWYAIRANGGWIERAWFEPMRWGPKTHMNGGHLILRAETFSRLRGFNEAMETGEDFEFCSRAKAAGIRIENDERLVAVHLGYPRTLGMFFIRELWHGRGDVQSWDAFKHSRVAMAAVVSTHASLAGLTWLLCVDSQYSAWLLLLAWPVASAAFLLKTFGLSFWRRFPARFCLSMTYLLARSLSVYRQCLS